MAREQHDYDDIPGTFVFDAERSRQGFGINMFCMSLMKDENRKAFKANEAEYLKKFNLTPEQTDAVLKRDYNRMLELGGNIYFTAKLGAADGHSFQHLAAVMTGNTQQDYASHDARRRPLGRRQPFAHGQERAVQIPFGRRGEEGEEEVRRREAESENQSQKIREIQIQTEISKTEVMSWPGSLQE